MKNSFLTLILSAVALLTRAQADPAVYNLTDWEPADKGANKVQYRTLDQRFGATTVWWHQIDFKNLNNFYVEIDAWTDEDPKTQTHIKFYVPANSQNNKVSTGFPTAAWHWTIYSPK